MFHGWVKFRIQVQQTGFFLIFQGIENLQIRTKNSNYAKFSHCQQKIVPLLSISGFLILYSSYITYFYGCLCKLSLTHAGWLAEFHVLVNSAIFSCDQAALRKLLSIRLSACPSVCHTFFTMFLWSFHHEIFRSDVHAKAQGQRSKSQSEVKTNFAIIWAFPDCNFSLNSQMATKWGPNLEVA